MLGDVERRLQAMLKRQVERHERLARRFQKMEETQARMEERFEQGITDIFKKKGIS